MHAWDACLDLLIWLKQKSEPMQLGFKLPRTALAAPLACAGIHGNTAETCQHRGTVLLYFQPTSAVLAACSRSTSGAIQRRVWRANASCCWGPCLGRRSKSITEPMQRLQLHKPMQAGHQPWQKRWTCSGEPTSLIAGMRCLLRHLQRPEVPYQPT